MKDKIERERLKRKMGSFGNQNAKVSLQKALDKVYEIRANIRNVDGSFWGVLSFPSILIGHKVKLILVK